MCHPKSLQRCPTLCDPTAYSPSGFSGHGILQARILEWIAMPSSRGSSQPRDWTHISCLLHWQMGSLPLAPPGKLNYWARALETRVTTAESTRSSYWSPGRLEPVLCKEKPLQWEARAPQLESSPLLTATREKPSQKPWPAQPKKKETHAHT